MKRLAGLVLACLATICVLHTPAVTTRMPVEEVRPGMTGVGVTVFEGTRRDEFDVEILGVLRNVMGPRRDIIVARLAGGPLAHTGVVAGMSGSPVYIDDRLIGAVSYALGSFAKEPIAGITPIDEMVASDANRDPALRLARTPPRFPLPGGGLHAVVAERGGGLEPLALGSADVRTLGLAQLPAAGAGALLRPIATPVALGGFMPQVQDAWIAALGSGGFAAAALGGQAVRPVSAEPLQAGDAVGAMLVRGDLTMAATGTVTMVEDGRVYAFGHPFFNLGSVRFPMTRAAVTTVLPSLALSSKIAAVGETVGTLDQDRATGIFGTLGGGPRMIPVRMELDAPRAGPARDVPLRGNRRSALHAAADLQRRPEHVHVVDPAARILDLCGAHHRPHRRPRRRHVRRRVQRPDRADQRSGRRGEPADRAAQHRHRRGRRGSGGNSRAFRRGAAHRGPGARLARFRAHPAGRQPCA